MPGMDQGAMPGMDHGAMPGMDHGRHKLGPSRSVLRTGSGLTPSAANGGKFLSYADLKAQKPLYEDREPTREIEIRLTGNMERFIWSINDQKLEAEPIRLRYGERVRFKFTNETMMTHPMHLHGMWTIIDNGSGKWNPAKHVVNVAPGTTVYTETEVDAPGNWAFHCHLLYHMETGMFRNVIVEGGPQTAALTNGAGTCRALIPRGTAPQVLVPALAATFAPGVGAGRRPGDGRPAVHPAPDRRALEYRLQDGDDLLAWEGEGRIGTDRNKAVLKSQGEYLIDPDKFDSAEFQLLYQRLISDFFDAQAGLRYDLEPEPGRAFAVLGINGLAPGWFEVDASLFVSEDANVLVRLEADYDLLLTSVWCCNLRPS